MISAEEALRRIRREARRLEEERTPLRSAAGRVLARAVRAAEDLPAFDNSSVDGWAVRAADTAEASRRRPVELRGRGLVRAGREPALRVSSGETMAVMTGAPIPPGADAVVPRENVRVDGDRAAVFAAIRAGRFIRRKGEDVRAGEGLAAAGARLRPYEISLLASQGVTDAAVVRRPRTALIITGDELAGPGRPPGPGRIRDGNGPALRSALERGGYPVTLQRRVKDRPPALRAALAAALERADAVLVSGGVSVGDFDFTRRLLKDAGAREVFWRVAVKPGKPLLFAVRDRGRGGRRLIFGLPGNPLSALVCLEEFVLPALEALEGADRAEDRYALRGRCLTPFQKSDARRQYLFCQAKAAGDGFVLDILDPQGSAMTGRACRANALAVSLQGRTRVERAERLRFRWLV